MNTIKVGDFLTLNRDVIIAYDHSTHIRKGYWYDEDAEWIEQEIEEQESYLNNI